MNNNMLTKEEVAARLIALTRTTTPYQHEQAHYGALMDSIGATYYADVGWNLDIGESRTMFACHLDTASSSVEPITHAYDGRYLRTTSDTILGADDKAGVVIFLRMIELGVPGRYWFFVGEECGRLGSEELVDWSRKDVRVNLKDDYDRVICFDRRGYSDVITKQSCGRTASDVFAQALCDQLYEYCGLFYQPSDRGVYTDSASFVHDISECTNISVGYFNEHSSDEMQDVGFLTRLVNGAPLIQWEALPTERELTPRTYHSSYGTVYGGGYSGYYSNKWDDDDFGYAQKPTVAAIVGTDASRRERKKVKYSIRKEPRMWLMTTHGNWMYIGSDPKLREKYGSLALVEKTKTTQPSEDSLGDDDAEEASALGLRSVTYEEAQLIMNAYEGVLPGHVRFPDYLEDVYDQSWSEAIDHEHADDVWREYSDIVTVLEDVTTDIYMGSFNDNLYPTENINILMMYVQMFLADMSTMAVDETDTLN